MKGLKYLITVTHREFEKEYLEFLRKNGSRTVLSTLTSGTATDSILNIMGIEKTEKVMFQTIVKEEDVEDIKHGLLSEMDIGAAGNGLAVFIPIDGLGGESAKNYFVGDKPIEKGEKDMSDNLTKTVLIVVIADKGSTDTVMEVARGAGATGGTVVKAKGTGAEMAKFFGVSISEEKEMIYIVSKRENRDKIMKAIMEKAGKDTEAHGIVFSLPVDGVVGIRAFED